MKTLSLRIPDDIHVQLVAYAKAQHRSLQAQIMFVLEAAWRADAGEALRAKEDACQSQIPTFDPC